MNEVTNFLKKNTPQYLASVGLDGKPKVRPFQFMLEEGGKLFFCTSNQKEIFREISRNPHIEISVSGESFSWLRLSGKAVLTQDSRVKEKILEASPMVKSIYHAPDNPVFEAFYLESPEAVLYDFSGNPPRKIAL